MKAQTPLLKQYFEAKEAHPGVLMAMRVGDFFEFYGEDAEIAARALEITLTGREDGKNGRVSMAGVPYHSVERYLAELVRQGYRVALCDQVEDPKKAKGLVRRAVTRVLSRGTVLEESMLSARANNFLAAALVTADSGAIALLDPSTGELLATEIEGGDARVRWIQELARLDPAEALLEADEAEAEALVTSQGAVVQTVDFPALVVAESELRQHFRVQSLQAFGLDERPLALRCVAAVLRYAAHHGVKLDHVQSLAVYAVEGAMQLDLPTRRSLELTANLSDGTRKHSLLEVMDRAVTAMGSRLLRRWIDQPLLDRDRITERLEAVGRCLEHAITRGDLRDRLKQVADIERLVSRTVSGLASPRDLVALRQSLEALPLLDADLRKVALGRLKTLRDQLGDHRDLFVHLTEALEDNPPAHTREGGFVRAGFQAALDELRDLARNGKVYIAQLEAKERADTGIERLKVGYNSVFGYYLEVPKSMVDRVPDHYVRKQTTANAERYITSDLKDYEASVLNAEEKSVALEQEIFGEICARVSACAEELLLAARALAELDVYLALAECASTHHWMKPEISEDDRLLIVQGRHAVVERGVGQFVPNDLTLGSEQPRLMVLTGPNMSGKSTFLRQTALIVLMAQMGSFVPAERCEMGLCDRIFTRIGARDELALGQSTFMVEMLESANILNNATERSLVILDEVGRGTSTFDGLAIAWAMVEHLAGVGSKTLFATHYHQLNQLAEEWPAIVNFRVDVEEHSGRVVWTHRVVPGGADRSYGIHVAQMAGVPGDVLHRAREILGALEGTESTVSAPPPTAKMQLTLFESDDPAVVRRLRELDVNQMTPMEALMELERLKREAGR